MEKKGPKRGKLEGKDLSKDEEERAAKLHKEATIIEGCIMWENLENPEYLDQVRRGGITAANVTVAHWLHDFTAATKRVHHYKELAEKNPDLLHVRRVEDIQEAKREGKLGVIIGFQDSKPIEDDLCFLRTFYDNGVRIIQLTYNAQNYVGTGCCELSCGKLSYFGREVVEEMNRIGMVIDLAHCCDETTIDAIECSKDPVIISHSGAYSICNAYGRNKKDEHIGALAKKGGIIGITFFPSLVKRDPRTWEVQKSTVEDVLDHIDYVVSLVGVDYVGWGSDMFGGFLDQKYTPPYSALRWWRPKRPDIYGRGPTEVFDPFPEGLDRHHKLLNLTRGLVSRGYSDAEIKKILGGNFIRVFERVWK